MAFPYSFLINAFSPDVFPARDRTANYIAPAIHLAFVPIDKLHIERERTQRINRLVIRACSVPGRFDFLITYPQGAKIPPIRPNLQLTNVVRRFRKRMLILSKRAQKHMPSDDCSRSRLPLLPVRS